MNTTGIKCGNCKGIHASVAEVRECCLNAPTAATIPAAKFQTTVTAKQEAFLRKLYVERNPAMGTNPEILDGVIDEILRAGKQYASKAIDGLLAQPKVAGTKSNFNNVGEFDELMEEIPVGYYAVDMGDTLRFFAMRQAKQSGRKYLRQVVGGTIDGYSIRRAARGEALAAIQAAGPEQAAIRYGHEIGQCYVCNRILTDESSRAKGIGPVCEAKGF